MVYETKKPVVMRAMTALVALSVPLGLASSLLPGSGAAVADLPAVEAVVTPMRAMPVAAGLAPAPLEEARETVAGEVRRGAFPGAALAVGRGSRLAMMEGIGAPEWDGGTVDPERTVYDIASLTKVVATTTAAMLLVEDGKVDLDAPVSRYLPAFSGGEKDAVTVRHLLAHTSGLPAWAAASGDTPEAALRTLVATPLKAAPGERMAYSDVGMVVLWSALEAAAGEPLAGLLERRVYGPLGMRQTRFGPLADCAACSPTRKDEDGAPVRGVVHDPIARKLGGVTGNAGLFSTAADLSRFAAMLASGGELEGVRVLKQETILAFAQRQPGAAERALGWETPKADGTGAGGLRLSRQAFGHTGFTGTSLWVDPDRGTWAVLLANRTFDPRASNRIQKVRRAIHAHVAEAADIGGVLAE